LGVLQPLVHLVPPSASAAESLSLFYDFSRPTDPNFSSFLDRIACTVNFQGWFFGHHHRDISLDTFHCMYNSIKELE
jgi:hypothetical protein